MPFLNDFLGNAPFPLARLPLCNYEGHHSRKNAFPKKGIAYGYFAKSGATVLSPPARGEIDYGNSVVHHPSHSLLNSAGAALNNEAIAAAMPATHALASKRSPSLFCFHFFSFTFFLLFFLHFSFFTFLPRNWQLRYALQRMG